MNDRYLIRSITYTCGIYYFIVDTIFDRYVRINPHRHPNEFCTPSQTWALSIATWLNMDKDLQL